QSPALVVQDCLFCSNTPDHIFGQWTDGGGNVFEDACEGDCAGDVTGDGTVGVNDILMVLGNYGNGGDGDVNGDGVVDVDDILIIISAWGPC
ncbi:MAG: hypothetical protein MK074_10140, partial [Phycisphaerales bacterium]|nr:hypothetical protein [Phycisphaerales bacterium]